MTFQQHIDECERQIRVIETYSDHHGNELVTQRELMKLAEGVMTMQISLTRIIACVKGQKLDEEMLKETKMEGSTSLPSKSV